MQTLERIKVLRDGSARRSEGHRDLYGYLSEANINPGYLSKGGMIATRLSVLLRPAFGGPGHE